LILQTVASDDPAGSDVIGQHVMDSAPKVKSKALEVNLADYYVDVAVDPKYAVLRRS
jgi:hypothetical protein